MRLRRLEEAPGYRENAIFAYDNMHKNGIFPAWGFFKSAGTSARN